MTIGNRIKHLRKNLNYSQEYVAEQLDVSRQAVSKWEHDLSSPDTNNLIRLAKLLNTTVEYIALGKESDFEIPSKNKKLTKKQKKIIGMIISMSILLVSCLSIVIYIHTRPVAWDSGACSGGYVTWIFDKYSNELTEKFLNGMGKDKEKIISIKAIRGSQSAEWIERNIFLQFDIEYEHEENGIIIETVRFIGTRYWIESFKWRRGAIIVG